MKFPSFLVSALVVGIVAVLNYLLAHVGAFHAPDLYAPLIALAISTVIKLVQEWQPQEEVTARSVVSEQASYVARVLYK